MVYDGTTYLYQLNLQGDVISIVNKTGTTMAEYVYDAWGRVLSSSGTLAGVNPLRYRGYYYDTESGLYYLGSRYYDPVVKRFINADDSSVLNIEQGSMLQYNLFVYCFNNPVVFYDDSGNLPTWANQLIGAAAIVAVAATVAAVTVATAGTGTVAAVIAVGAAKGAAIGMVSGAVTGAGGAAVKHRVTTGSWNGAASAALKGGSAGALSGSVTGVVTGAASATLKVATAARSWSSGTFRSGYSSMKYHYNKHVVSEGLSKGNSVVRYTRDALDFSRRNSSALKYTYNYKYGNATWNYAYKAGSGGMYTSAGKIATFWYK